MKRRTSKRRALKVATASAALVDVFAKRRWAPSGTGETPSDVLTLIYFGSRAERLALFDAAPPQVQQHRPGNLMAALPAYAMASARWFVSPYGYGAAFARLGASAMGLAAITVGAEARPTYCGFPIEPVAIMPTGSGTQLGKIMVAFGDLSLAATLGRAAAADRAVACPLPRDGPILIRGTQRFDANVLGVGDNASAGPIVGLVGA